MISDFTLFVLYVAAVTAVGFFALAFWYASKARVKKDISRSFNLQLFHVVLPRPELKQKEPLTLEQIREKISVMEKLYASLHDIFPGGWFFKRPRPTFAFELTVPHTGEEILFYIAVPRLVGHSLAKIVEAVFPDAQVAPSKDYNIFNPDGVSVGGFFKLDKNDFLPFRTYRSLESDPLKELSNAFSHLAAEGEGAAFQVIIRPASEKVSKNMLSFAKEAFMRGDIQRQGVLKEIFREIFGTGPSRERKSEEKRLTPKQEEMIKAIENKAGKALFEANFRLIASAPNESRAQEILRNLKAPFLQFEDPSLNKLSFSELSGSALRKLFYRFSFRLFDDAEKILVSSEELTSAYHFPNVPLETPKVRLIKAREAPPPVDLPKEGVLIGYNVFRGQETPVRLSRDDRRRHVYIIGQTGTGKTALLENMIRQDIENGEGVCYIDPHGDTVEKILGFVPKHRMEDVVYFDPGDVAYPMGLNMMEYDPAHPEQKTFVVDELLDIFLKLFGAVPEALGPMFQQYFRNSALLVMEDPSSGNTLLEIERIMTDKDFRDLKLSRSTNVVVNTFWRDVAEKAGGEASLANMVPYITSKFDTFLANEIMRPIIAQEHSAFSFRDVMDNQKILLVNLSKGRLGELNSSLIGLIMVGKLLMASLARGTDIPEYQRKDFYAYIDEFQNVTTKSIATILAEARKYRLSLILAHQYVGQLEDVIKKAVFGNVGTQISFRIGPDDAEFVAKQYSPVFEPEDLLNVDNFNAFVKMLVKGQTARPFNLRTYPPVAPNLENAAAIKELSRLKYGRPREEVEAEVRGRYQSL